MGKKKNNTPEKKKLRYSSLIQTLQMLAIIIVLGAISFGYAVVEREISPKYVLARCMDWYGTGNLEGLWREAALPSSYGLTQDDFEKWCMKGRESKLLSYEYEVEHLDDKYIYHVTFLEEESSVPKKIDIELVKSGEKKYGIFPIYRYSLDSQIIENIDLQFYENSEVSIDGEEIDEYYLKTEDGLDWYHIDYMFKGDYGVSVTSHIVGDIEDTISVTKNESTFRFDRDTSLSEQNSEVLKNIIRGLINHLYGSIMADSNYTFEETVAALDLKVSEQSKKSFNKLIKEMVNQLYYEEEGIVILDFSNMKELKLDVKEYEFPKSVTYEFVYQFDYTGLSDFDLYGNRTEIKGTKEVIMTCSFMNEEGAWVIDDVSMASKELEIPEELEPAD